MPVALYDFITCCASSKDYRNVIISSDVDVDRRQQDLKVLSICHGVIAHSRMVRTPLQLGFAIKVSIMTLEVTTLIITSQLGPCSVI